MFLGFSFRTIFLVVRLVLVVLLTCPSFHAAAQSGGGRISYGESVTDAVSKDSPVHEWVFRGTAGDTVSITIAPGPVGGFSLKDELGSSLADVFQVHEAFSNVYRLDGFVLPRTGSYRIVVKPNYVAVKVEYTLSLRLQERKTNFPQLAENGGPIAYNSTVAGHLTIKELEDIQRGQGSVLHGDVWTFSGKRGDVVGVSLDELGVNEIDPKFRLLTKSGAVVSEGSVGKPEKGAMLPITGDYIVNVMRGRSTAEVYYSLSLKLVEQLGDDGLQPMEGGNVGYGKLALGVLNNGNNLQNVWTFEGKSGDVISVQMRALSYAWSTPYMFLRTAGNDQPLRQGAESDDKKGSVITEFRVPASGKYTLQVTAAQMGLVNLQWPYGLAYLSYYYELMLTSALPNFEISHGGTLEFGTTRAGEITDTNLEDKWTFQGNSGDQVTIVMKRLNGSMVADFEVFGPDGRSIGIAKAAQDRNNAELVDFKLPSSGTYTIVARPFSSNGRGTYSITVMCAGCRGQSINPSSIAPTSAREGVDGATQSRVSTATARISVAGSTPTSLSTPIQCPKPPKSRLAVGKKARGAIEGKTNRLRSTASLLANTLGQIPYGQTVIILAGPQCGDGETWWRVKHEPSGLEGWLLEGSGTDYYLQPAE